MTFKEEVYEAFGAMVAEKISLLRRSLQDLAESAGNETKSSAGDKYETGRAMLQIEQDNVRRQIGEALAQKAAFDALDKGTRSVHAAPGCLVHTSNGCFFLGVALGKVLVRGITVIALSPQSPLGSKLNGAAAGTDIRLNVHEFRIERIE